MVIPPESAESKQNAGVEILMTINTYHVYGTSMLIYITNHDMEMQWVDCHFMGTFFGTLGFFLGIGPFDGDILEAKSENISVYGVYTEDVVNNHGNIVTGLVVGVSLAGFVPTWCIGNFKEDLQSRMVMEYRTNKGM